MITMPNGYSRSNFTVVPKNWKSERASIKKQWRIYYRFYDDQGNKKQCPISGMNHAKSADARRRIVEDLIANEIELLEVQGFNPITRKFKPPDNLAARPVTEQTPVFKALAHAIDWLDCVPETRRAVRLCVDVLAKCGSGANNTCIYEVKPKHVMSILKTVADKRQLTAVTYNHYRAYLMMLFKVLIPLGVIEFNPVREIPKRKVVKKIRQTLTVEERAKVREFLQQPAQYSFYRYVQIFFASGARTTELFSVQAKHVELSRQRYKCTIRKGRQWVEVYKTIKDVVMPLWTELLQGARPDDFIFSHGLKPGAVKNTANQITRRWRKYIKGTKAKPGLGITADFYSLKHLHSTEIVSLKDAKAAAAMNSHRGEAMVVNIYDTMQDQRRHDELKGISNTF